MAVAPWVNDIIARDVAGEFFTPGTYCGNQHCGLTGMDPKRTMNRYCCHCFHITCYHLSPWHAHLQHQVTVYRTPVTDVRFGQALIKAGVPAEHINNLSGVPTLAANIRRYNYSGSDVIMIHGAGQVPTPDHLYVQQCSGPGCYWDVNGVGIGQFCSLECKLAAGRQTGGKGKRQAVPSGASSKKRKSSAQGDAPEPKRKKAKPNLACGAVAGASGKTALPGSVADESLDVQRSSVNPQKEVYQSGTIFESDGKRYMTAQCWHKAATAFIGAFKCYDEAAMSQKIDCLRYLALAGMMINSSLERLDSDSDWIKPYQADCTLVMTELRQMRTEKPQTAAQPVTRTEEAVAVKAKPAKDMQTQLATRTEDPAKDMRTPKLQTQPVTRAKDARKVKVKPKRSRMKLVITRRAKLQSVEEHAEESGKLQVLLKNAWEDMVEGLTTVEKARCLLLIFKFARQAAVAKRINLRVQKLASVMKKTLVGMSPSGELNELNCQLRTELWLVAAHKDHWRGVVESSNDRKSNTDWMIYSGAGGNNKIDDDDNSTKPHADQLKTNRGSSALIRSMETGSRVRVIQLRDLYYRYLGAFYVRAVWLEKRKWKGGRVTEGQLYYDLSEDAARDVEFGRRFNEWREGEEGEEGEEAEQLACRSWLVAWHPLMDDAYFGTEREENLFAAFSYFDRDGIDELQSACREHYMGDDRLEEMLREIDTDNDGRIDYNELEEVKCGTA